MIYGEGIDMDGTPKAAIRFLQESPLYKSCWRYMSEEQRARGTCPTTNKMCPRYSRGRCSAYPKKGQPGRAA